MGCASDDDEGVTPPGGIISEATPYEPYRGPWGGAWATDCYASLGARGRHGRRRTTCLTCWGSSRSGVVDMLVPRYVTGDGSHDHTRTSRVPSSTVHTPRV